jgi:HK97 family phage major capsid protein
MERIRAHLLAERGMDEAKATSTAIATATLFCSSGRSPNLPVTVNAQSRAEACAAVAELRAMKAGKPKEEPVATVTDKPWDGSPSRFTDEQYARSCVLDRGPSVTSTKERYSLPIREPDGTLSRAGVHAAAAMIGKVKASPELVRKAARALIAAYRQLGEEPPANLKKLAGAGAAGTSAGAAGTAAGAAAAAKSEKRDLGEALEERSAPDEAPPPRIVGNKLVGLIPYATTSHDLGGWTERIEPGAARDAVKQRLVATLNHNRDRLLGRFPTTLTTEDRDDGMAWEVELPGGPTGQDVREAVARGDLNGTSWRMIVGKDRWEGDLRIIERIDELRDVSVVVDPAYPTSLELRSRPEPRPATPEPPVEEETTMDEHEHEEEREVERPPEGGGLVVEERSGGGSLRVEERTAEPEGGDIESRIAEAFEGIQKGEARSLTTDAATAITPPELSTYIFDKLTPRSVALASGIRVIPTDRHTIEWPTIVSDPDAEWVAETDPITPSDPVFDSLTAEPKKLASLVQFSNEVLDDSVPDAGATVRTLMLRALAGKLDLSIFEGNPTADPESIKGLKYQAGIQTDSALGADGGAIPAGADGLDLVTEALGLLEDADVPGPYAVVMRPSVWRQFRELRDGQGRRLLQPGATSIEAATVYTTTRLSSNETRGTSNDTSSIYVYSTDPDVGPVLVRRSDVTVDLDRSRLFNQDMSELRAKTRVDFIVPQPLAVVRIVGVRPAA